MMRSTHPYCCEAKSWQPCLDGRCSTNKQVLGQWVDLAVGCFLDILIAVMIMTFILFVLFENNLCKRAEVVRNLLVHSSGVGRQPHIEGNVSLGDCLYSQARYHFAVGLYDVSCVTSHSHTHQSRIYGQRAGDVLCEVRHSASHQVSLLSSSYRSLV